MLISLGLMSDRKLAVVMKQFGAGKCAETDLLRALVSHETWRIPIGRDDGPLLTSTAAGDVEYLVAELGAAGEAKDAGDNNAENTHLVISGRNLVREWLPNFKGVAFEPNRPWSVSCSGELLPQLQRWAISIDLEEAIASPAPGQVAMLRDSPWWVAVKPGTQQPAVLNDFDEISGYYRRIHIATAEDASRALATIRRHEVDVVQMEGKTLWSSLERSQNFDGIRINRYHPGVAIWPPHMPAALMAGRDPRPEVTPLPARTIAEIHRWLDYARFRRDKRSHVLRQKGDRLVAVYEAWMEYTPQEILFELVEPTEDPTDFGEGRTQILCAGCMVTEATVKLAGLPERWWPPQEAWEYFWAEPALKEKWRRRAAEAVSLLRELKKLIDDSGYIPFSALRTGDGARKWREFPEKFSADWIDRVLKKASRFASQ